MKIVNTKEPEMLAPVVAEIKAPDRPINSIRLMPGHKIWMINLDTKDVTEAEYETTTSDMQGNVRKKLIVPANCIPVAALNIKNAMKKLDQMYR
jgi:glycine cleavage system regulatory protein